VQHEKSDYVNSVRPVRFLSGPLKLKAKAKVLQGP